MKNFTLYMASIALLVGTIFSTVTASFGQSTAGPNNAGTGQNVTGVGTIAWTSPGNILTNNDVYSSVALPNNGSTSNYLRGTGYGFAIPVNATILGITVTIGKYSSNFIGLTAMNDNTVYLVKAGAAAGSNRAQGTWPTSETAVQYGGTADLWGTTWTPADINNTNFGAEISAINNTGFGISYTAYVDYIQITVTYQVCVDPDIPTLSASVNPVCPGAGTTLSVTAGSLNNATAWHWYSGSCGGTPVGTGVSINVSPTVNTTYFARGEGGCVIPGSCGSIAVTVYPAQAATDYFRSRASGNWSNPSTWERSSDNSFWCTATAAPTNAAALITVRNTHTVTVDGNSTGSTVLISGILNGGTGTTLSVTGDFTGTGTFTAGTGRIVLNGTGAQQLGAFTYYDLSNENSTAIVTAAGPITVNGMLDNGGSGNVSATLDMLAYTLTLNGTKGNNGGTIKFSGTGNGISGWASGTIVYEGSASGQNVTAGSYGSLTINNPNGVTLSGNVIVNGYKHFENGIPGALDLISGIVHTGSHTLTVGAVNSITGSSATTYVSGKLAREYTASGSKDFPIGKAAYHPVVLNFTALTGNSTVTAEQFDGGFPGTPPLGTIQVGTRYWNLTETGSTARTYDLTLDGSGLTFTDEARILKHDAGTTVAYVPTTPDYTVTGLTSFSDFALGQVYCYPLPTATLSGNQTICSGHSATLSVALTGTPNWSYTWSDGTNTGTVTGVTASPSTFTVNPAQTTSYTILSVTDGRGCINTGTGSAKVDVGPIAVAQAVPACNGSIVEVPVTVKNFHGVGAISLTLNYDWHVIKYDSYVDNSGDIDYVSFDESGTKGVVRFSGIAGNVFPPLADGDVLITLKFNYDGGTCALEWNDSEDTWCEFATGAPDFIPFCDDETGVYYVNGTVTDASVVADFSADDVTPPTHATVLFTDATAGATSWLWSFDRTDDVSFVEGTSASSQNPKVQFLRGGAFTVTLTAGNGTCSDTEIKTAYIWAGTPGLWTGNTSTAWYDNTNWDDYRVPTSTVDVTVPAEPEGDRYPYVPGDLETGDNCLDITIEGPAEITVQGEFIVQPGTNVIITGTGEVKMHFVP